MKKSQDCIKGILFCFLLLLLFYICPNLVAITLKNQILSDNFWISNFAYLGTYVVTFFVILFIVHKDIFKEWKEFLKNPKQCLRKGCTYWVYGIILMILSNLIVSSLVQNIAVNEQVTRDTLFLYPIYAIPSIIFFGPFLEEMIFRYAFRKPFKKEIPYALCSAFVFGLLHVLTAVDTFTIENILAHASEFLFIIPYGSLGFFFAKAYYETDNLFSSIIPHILHNTISVSLIILSNLVM